MALWLTALSPAERHKPQLSWEHAHLATSIRCKVYVSFISNLSHRKKWVPRTLTSLPFPDIQHKAELNFSTYFRLHPVWDSGK